MLGEWPVPVVVSPPDVGRQWTLYDDVVVRLRDSAVFSDHRPEEDADTSAQALWYAAAGAPRPVAGLRLPLPDLSVAQQRTLHRLVARRIAGEPLAYVTGRSDFLGLEFLSSPGALIPRRETELLGAGTLAVAREIARANSLVRILDLCTGSGNLAVSLAVLEPRARVWAVDLHAKAVAVARNNAAFHDVADRVSVVPGDLFDAPSLPADPFDVIVCNPPYLPSDAARNLPPEVFGREPLAAFDGGESGLAVVDRLISEAPGHLVPRGWLCIELGVGNGHLVERLLARHGSYDEIRKTTNQCGSTRAVFAQRVP